MLLPRSINCHSTRRQNGMLRPAAPVTAGLNGPHDQLIVSGAAAHHYWSAFPWFFFSFSCDSFIAFCAFIIMSPRRISL